MDIVNCLVQGVQATDPSRNKVRIFLDLVLLSRGLSGGVIGSRCLITHG